MKQPSDNVSAPEGQEGSADNDLLLVNKNKSELPQSTSQSGITIPSLNPATDSVDNLALSNSTVNDSGANPALSVNFAERAVDILSLSDSFKDTNTGAMIRNTPLGIVGNEPNDNIAHEPAAASEKRLNVAMPTDVQRGASSSSVIKTTSSDDLDDRNQHNSVNRPSGHQCSNPPKPGATSSISAAKPKHDDRLKKIVRKIVNCEDTFLIFNMISYIFHEFHVDKPYTAWFAECEKVKVTLKHVLETHGWSFKRTKGTLDKFEWKYRIEYKDHNVDNMTNKNCDDRGQDKCQDQGDT